MALIVPGALALTGLAVAVWTGSGPIAVGFAVAAGLGLGGGGALAAGFRASRSDSALLGRRDGAGPTVAIAWLTAAGLASVPFAVAGTVPGGDAFAHPVGALFEAMSGLTSTGLSVAPDASALSPALQWWRSLLQWVGGIGILYVALALSATEGAHAAELDQEMNTDAAGGARRVVAVWGLYLGYTVATGLAFRAAGMPGWEALNHALTTVSTGGFAVTADSFASYGRGIQAIAVVAMALGAVSFGTHVAVLLRGRVAALATDAELRSLGVLLGVGVGVLAVAVRFGDELPVADVAFTWASAFLTGGFSTTDLTALGTLPLLLVTVAMLVGGASGSTAGGFKQRRVLWLTRWAGGRLQPGTVERHGRPALHQLGRMAGALAVGAGLLMAFGAPPVPALFEAASALGTVGLSAGVSGPEASVGTQLVLIGLMWMGRLEIAAVVALVLRRRPREPRDDA